MKNSIINNTSSFISFSQYRSFSICILSLIFISLFSSKAMALPQTAAITFTISAHTYGSGSFTLTATSSSTGAFTFSSANTSIATCTGGTVTANGKTTVNATCNLIGAGTVNITVNQAAVTGLWNANNKTTALLINKATPVITFPPTIVTYGDADFTITNCTSTSPGAFTYGSTQTSVFTVSGTTVHIVGVGFGQIDASQAATANYNALSAYGDLTVNGITPSFSYTINDTTVNYTTSPFNINNPVSNSSGAFTYESSDLAIATISGNQVTTTGAGVVSITCTQAADGFYAAGIISFSLTVLDDQITQVWTGAISTDWYNPDNWSNIKVPLNYTGNANIPSTPVNQPEISNDVNINDITLNGHLSINGFTFGVGGLITGTGYFKGSATSSLAVASISENTLKFGTSATDSLLKNLTLTVGQVSLANGLGVTGVLGVYGCIFNTNNHLTLKSDSSSTAAVDDITAGGNYVGSQINGIVTVERFHSNKRSWAMMSAPLTTYGAGNTVKGDIKSNWQKYTYVTGALSPLYGLDAGTNTAYGIKYWNGTAWGNGFSANTALKTDSAHTLFGGTGNGTADNKPFFLFVRGDRSILPNTAATQHSKVTLAARGVLQTGTLTQGFAGTTYGLVANPYAAPIDLDLFRTDNINLSNGGDVTFYYWDPNLSGTGGYVTAKYLAGEWSCLPLSTGNNSTLARYIQSGQAFFVMPNGGSSSVTSVTFNESQKSTINSSNAVFSNNVLGSVNVNLSKGSPLSLVDGIVTLYNNVFSSVVNAPSEDAIKFWGNEENVAILRDGSYLSIEARPDLGLTDTTFLYMNKMIAGTTYNFAITGANIPPTTTGYLVDQYLNTQTALDLTSANSISFKVDTAAAAKSASRFMIVFGNKSPLSVSGMEIKASVKAKSAVIDYSVISEKNVDHYTVERSTDAKTFVSIASQTANNVNNSHYSYTDNQASVGVNYFRIKAISKDGTIQYSSIAKATIGDSKEGISVYPNPIQGKEVNVILSNITAGNYAISMYNSAGQQVMMKNIEHAGGSVTSTVALPSNISTGVYLLKLTGNGNNYTETIIVK